MQEGVLGARTGVATTISGEVRSVAACTLMERPPTTSAARTSVNCARLLIMLCTCMRSEESLYSTHWLYSTQ